MRATRHLNPLLKLALEVGPLVVFFLANAYSDRFGVAEGRRIFAATGVFIVATVGQNALSQVELFRQTAGVTGLVMTKLDGTARGGILVALAAKFGVPVHYIGVGEGVEDLEPFAARDFARAIAGLEQAA